MCGGRHVFHRAHLQSQGSRDKEKITELENQNNLLHSSLSSLTSQMEKLQASRVTATLESADATADEQEVSGGS